LTLEIRTGRPGCLARLRLPLQNLSFRRVID